MLDLIKKKERCVDNNEQQQTYTKKDHMDWVDDKNEGISHYGIHPTLLPRGEVRFDMFHLKCSVTKKLMNYLREFILRQNNTVCVQIENILRTFWNDFHIHVWKHKKKFSLFQGNELALFVANSNTIIDFLAKTFVQIQEVQDIQSSLRIWMRIFKFLSITTIKEGTENQYITEMNTVFNLIDDFYKVGRRTFLSSHGKIGNLETFYMHTLRYYVPNIARITFERHATGVGVFSMQGFERRNKE